MMFNHIIRGIKKYGRPLEHIRLLQLLEGNHENEILEALSSFQNEDGGFGHGLEPDNFDIHSSPLQTWCAINHLREIKFDENHPMIIKMFDYLYFSFDQKIQRWPLYMKTVMNHPHAPWWDYKETKDSYNPTASLIGFIIKYAPKDHKISTLTKNLKKDAYSYVSDLTNPLDMHDLRCFIEMIEDLHETDDSEQFHYARTQMIKRIDQTLEKDENKWHSSYCAKPSYLFPRKNSLGADLYHDLVVKELKMLDQSKNDEGLWNPTFTWQNQTADQIWQSIIALSYLKLKIDYQI
jgi:hypothetical protein